MGCKIRILDACASVRALASVVGFLALAAGAPAHAGPPTTTCNGLDDATYSSCLSGSSVARFRCWEKELTSNVIYGNAYKDVKLRVDIATLNDQERHSVYAFWDGDDPTLTPVGNLKRFKFRTNFTSTGTFTWSTVCEEGCSLATETGGLLASGSVTVTDVPAGESNRFYKMGKVISKTVSRYDPNGGALPDSKWTNRPLAHSNGDYFFWQGDTAWVATLRACRSEWTTYILDRKAKGITVVQLGLAQDWAGQQAVAPFSGTVSRRGVAPFRQVGAATGAIPNSDSRWVSEFWRELDGMISYANDNGVLVMVGGLTHPVHKYPTLGNARLFARNLAARLNGFHVAISPGLDELPSSTSNPVYELIDNIGIDIYGRYGNRILLVNHYGTPEGDSSDSEALASMKLFHSHPWLKLHLFQSGKNGGNVERGARRAKNLPQGLRGFTLDPILNGTYWKQAINGEAIYDYGYGVESGTDEEDLDAEAFNSYRARQAGWLSWLSGATGYTFGAAGIWEWGMCSMSPPPNPATCADDASPIPQNDSNGEGDFRNYLTASQAVSSTKHMTLLSFAMTRLDWWGLVANEQGQIYLNGGDERFKRVMARDPDQLLAYLPHNDRVKLNTTNKNVLPESAKFYDPRRPGQPLSPPQSTTDHGNGIYSYYQPGGLTDPRGSDDWVLVLASSTSVSMTWTGSLSPEDANTLEASPDIDPTEEGIADLNDGGMIRARIVSPTGATILEGMLPIQPASPSLPRRIRAARDGQGRFLLSWEKVDDQGKSVALSYARVDSALHFLDFGDEILPSVSGIQLVSSTIAADDSGDFLIAWEERSPEGGAPRILVQRFLEDGRLEGSEIEIASVEAGVQHRPRAACAPSGECWVAWEHSDEESGTVTIRAQRLDTNRSPTGLDFQLSSLVSGDLWLTNLSMQENGDVTATWERFEAPGESLGIYATSWTQDGALLTEETLISPPPADE